MEKVFVNDQREVANNCVVALEEGGYSRSVSKNVESTLSGRQWAKHSSGYRVIFNAEENEVRVHSFNGHGKVDKNVAAKYQEQLLKFGIETRMLVGGVLVVVK
jgi:hypothetical protein